MTNLLTESRPVKSTTVLFDSTRPTARGFFGSAKLYRKPSPVFEPSMEDRLWWAQNSDEPNWDALAGEAAAMDLYGRGIKVF